MSLADMPYTFELQRLPSHDEVRKEMAQKASSFITNNEATI